MTPRLLPVSAVLLAAMGSGAPAFRVAPTGFWRTVPKKSQKKRRKEARRVQR